MKYSIFLLYFQQFLKIWRSIIFLISLVDFFIILTHITLYTHSFFSISHSFIYNQTFGLMRNIEWIIFVCHHDGTNLSSGCTEQPRIIHSITLRDHTRHRMKFFLNQIPYLTCKEGISKISRILCTFFSFDTWDLAIELAKLKLITIKLLFYDHLQDISFEKLYIDLMLWSNFANCFMKFRIVVILLLMSLLASKCLFFKSWYKDSIKVILHF